MKMKPLYRLFKIILPPFFTIFAHTSFLGKKRKDYGKAKPLMLICNHLSMQDTLLVAFSHKRQIYYLGKKELVQNKFVGSFLSKLGIIPVDRGQTDLTAMRTVLNHLKAGDDLAIYPEGTRNKVDNRLCKVYGGAAFFAVKTKTKIVPLAFNRAARFGKHNFMVIGDPFELSDFYGQRMDNVAAEKADEVIRMRLIRVKRMADYFASIKGKRRKRLLKKQLNNPRLSFDLIYDFYEPYLLDYDQSVAPDDFDQTVRPQKSSNKRKQKTQA